jgi:pimeloyl-ACP methyl ester carboxylesterase
MATLPIPPRSLARSAPGARFALGACLALAIGCASTSPASPSIGGPTAPWAPTPPRSRAVSAAPAAPAAQATGDARFDAELTAYTYPFRVQFRELTSQRQTVRMAYMDVAAAQPNGHTVVLLHGKNFGAYYWEPTIKLLTTRGYRVIAPDQIGFGKSSKPERYQYSFQQLAANTRAVLDAAGVSTASIIGHSMGGMLATRYALMYPDRVEKLILVNPIGLEDWKTVIPARTIDQLYEQEKKATPESIRDYQRNAYYGGAWKPEYEKMIEPAVGMLGHPDYPKVAWASALTSDMVYSQPVVYEFPNVKVPTLLVIGQRDRTAPGRALAPKDAGARLGDYPALGKKTAAAIAGAKLVEIASAGHVPQVEAFDAYAQAITEFLPR